jgi:protein-disulfide isomerase
MIIHPRLFPQPRGSAVMFFAYRHALALLVLLMAALTLPARADEPLTPEQKQAVEQVVHDYLMKNPKFVIEVLEAAREKMKQDKEEGSRQALSTKHDELYSDPSSPIGGNPKGDVTIVEFFDYSCPYCKQVEPQIEALLKEDRKIRIVYKEFPVLGEGSVYASSMALAALKQGKYTAFHDAMIATKGHATEEMVLKVAADVGVNVDKAKAIMKEPEIQDILKRNYALADSLEINGTPAFVIGNTLVPGATTVDNLKKLVADARKQG